jgi:uncharacterized protein YgbK (DUF1537 family)
MEGILACIAASLHAKGIRRFVVSGGQASGAVLEALKVEALKVDSYITAGQSHAMAPTRFPSISSPASSGR